MKLVPIPSEIRHNRKLDVVFLHGLGDNEVDAWQQKNVPSSFWPKWLADDFEQVQIWMLRYEAAQFWFRGGKMALPDRATSVLDYLVGNGLGQRHILFVAHSLGGLVVKKLLQDSKTIGAPRLETIGACTRGIVFIATPHAGSSVASAARLILIASKATSDLQVDDAWLLSLNAWYRNNARQFHWITRAFCENQPIGPALIVSKSSADPNVEGEVVVPIDADHIGISKPESRRAPIYLAVHSLTAELVGAVATDTATLEQKTQLVAYAKNLRPPGNPMTVDDPLYVSRAADETCVALAEQIGCTMTIKGPRQIGKSSLLTRILSAAQNAGKKPVLLHLLLDHDILESASRCYRYFAASVATQLDLPNDVETFWDGRFTDPHNCTTYFAERILPKLKKPMMLAVDPADVLFKASFRSDFFGMLRTWHNDRGSVLTTAWTQLDIVLVVSNEPKYFIDRADQSPFNVGEIIRLSDFSKEQVCELNDKFRSPLTEGEIEELHDLLGGHPYLTQRALYAVTAARPALSPRILFSTALEESSPFADHLERIVRTLTATPALIPSLLDVFGESRKPRDQINLDRLTAIGLIKREKGKITPRCRLYTEYLSMYADDFRRLSK